MRLGGIFCLGIFSFAAILPRPDARATTLHFGNNSMVLGTKKLTAPALGVTINGITYWGALYDGAAPGTGLRIRTNDTDYWLGQNCAAGLYSENGLTACQNCGPGYFCTGGRDRTACTYGAIGCPGANETADGARPAGAPVNTFMNLDDVKKYIPATDISQWRMVSCCREQSPGGVFADWHNPETLNDARAACANGTLGPGTYLFTTQYSYSDGRDTPIDSIAGGVGNASAFIAVFDHSVGYRSIHGNSLFQHFVDTNNAAYQSWTISTAPTDGNWFVNKNETNVSNIPDSPLYSSPYMMCVFELK